MRNISRRRFLNGSILSAAGALALRADPLGLPIGCQIYPVRDALQKDFDGTLRELAGIGYRTIEMCSPPGYKLGPLVDMKAEEMRRRIHAAGLTCESSHFTLRELRDNLPERIAFAKELGLRQMILSSFGVRPEAKLDDWARAAGELNKIAEQVKGAGMQAGFHNHDGEFAEIDGTLIYDKVMSELDPKLVKMQFQFPFLKMGREAAFVFQKYAGRFISLHMQDWLPAEKKMVAVGKGEVDWKAVFAAARKAGVKNYFVELKLEQMKESYPYLHALRI